MSAPQTPAVKAFDTAYPGSMVARGDGYYVERNGHRSMAAALVELIASRDREIEDLRDALKDAQDRLAKATGSASHG